MDTFSLADHIRPFLACLCCPLGGRSSSHHHHRDPQSTTLFPDEDREPLIVDTQDYYARVQRDSDALSLRSNFGRGKSSHGVESHLGRWELLKAWWTSTTSTAPLSPWTTEVEDDDDDALLEADASLLTPGGTLDDDAIEIETPTLRPKHPVLDPPTTTELEEEESRLAEEEERAARKARRRARRKAKELGLVTGFSETTGSSSSTKRSQNGVFNPLSKSDCSSSQTSSSHTSSSRHRLAHLSHHATTSSQASSSTSRQSPSTIPTSPSQLGWNPNVATLASPQYSQESVDAYYAYCQAYHQRFGVDLNDDEREWVWAQFSIPESYSFDGEDAGAARQEIETPANAASPQAGEQDKWRGVGLPPSSPEDFLSRSLAGCK